MSLNSWIQTFILIWHLSVSSASSPSGDAVQFHDLMDHMASILHLPSGFVEEVSHPVLNVLGAPFRNRMSLPILNGLLQPVKTIWAVPAFCQPLSKKADKLYQVPQEGFSYSPYAKFSDGCCCQ